MKTLIIRTMTGAVFAVAMIGSIYWRPEAFALLMLVFSFLASVEFFRVSCRADIRPQIILSLVTGAFTYFIIAWLALGHLSAQWLLVLLPLLFIPFITELYRKTPNPFSNVAFTLLPVFYLSVPLAMLNFLFSPYQLTGEFFPNVLAGFFFILWTNDTMAYLGGMLLGRHKLFERISPKKTWEGSIVGGIFGLAMGWFISLFFTELSAWEWIGMSAVIIVFSTFGDLAESMFKRSYCVKDSGSLLPGHGGFLDRFDGVLLSAPFVFLYLNLINGNL